MEPEAQVDDEVLQRIPHRPPFLFVDEIVELSSERVVARRTLRADEAFYAGHYPQQPITPGVLICEAIFQAGALLASEIVEGGETDGKAPVLTRIREAKFRRAVLPGETVELEVTLEDRLQKVFVFRGTARVDGQLAVRVGFACALVDEAAISGQS